MELFKQKITSINVDQGSTKIEKKFLWYPLNIDGTTKWFEFVYVEMVVDVEQTNSWKLKRFVTAEEMKQRADLNSIITRLDEIAKGPGLRIDVIASALQDCYRSKIDPITALNDAIEEYSK